MEKTSLRMQRGFKVSDLSAVATAANLLRYQSVIKLYLECDNRMLCPRDIPFAIQYTDN